MMRILPIASSSKGNAYIVEQGDEALLIDCGVCLKTLCAAYDLSRVRGILVTHNHTDHVAGLRVFLNAFDIPVFANAMTAEAIAWQEKVDESAFVRFENGQSFSVGPFAISPFSVPHDAVDPVGYLIRGDETYFHGTDIGTPTDLVGLKLSEADVATLESNHDPVLLQKSDRPASLKQRISGPRGHLSNDQACELVARFASPRLKRLFLAHLSRVCNAPQLAREAMEKTLRRIGCSETILQVLD